MQYRGIIEDWDDERGFGFVLPEGQELRAFVHVNEFAYRSRRPVDGDAIVFHLALNAENRSLAVRIRFEGESRPAPRPRRRFSPGVGLGRSIALIFTVLLGVLWFKQIIPAGVPLFYLVMSNVTALIYAKDKVAASDNMPRTNESTLQILAFLGGWPGALLGQWMFRHKTRKQSFRYIFSIAVALNCIAFVAYLSVVTNSTLSSAFAWVKSSFEEIERPTFNDRGRPTEVDESELPEIAPGPK